MTHDELLAFYTAPGLFTSLAGFEPEIDALPNDVTSIAGAVQGLLIHHALAPMYQVVLPEERVAELQIHGADAMLARGKSLDARPVSEVRFQLGGRAGRGDAPAIEDRNVIEDVLGLSNVVSDQQH